MSAVDAVVMAWTDPGHRPDVHRRAQRELRRSWPTLATAVAALVKERRQPTTRLEILRQITAEHRRHGLEINRLMDLIDTLP